MKNINLSVDGGGTSLRIIAFDDDLKLVAQSGSGSVNPNYESAEKINENISEAVKLLLANLNADFKIKNIYETIIGPVGLFNEVLTRESGSMTEGASFHSINEGHSHLFAASLGDKGGVALAGTGSVAVYCNKSEIIHIGGYGIPIGDEGSGAWIGIQGISAAIKYLNGWGEKTALADKLFTYLNIDAQKSLLRALYRPDISRRGLQAGFCRYVAECERAGDKIAKDIIYSAGRNMGLQMISILQRAENKKILESPLIIYASGGAWKGTPYMLEAMAETIRGVYPGAVCKHGLFDPVVAGAVKFIFDETGEYKISDQYKEHLKKEFKDYLVKFNEY